MGDLNIKELKFNEAKKLGSFGYDISLKRDGCLIYWTNNLLISARKIDRTDRFQHIKHILWKNNFPDCVGEMYIDGGKVFDVSSKKNWEKARFMPIDLLIPDIDYKERMRLMTRKVKEMESRFITPLKLFDTFEIAWDYVMRNNYEGLIIRNEREWYKVKVLNEAKIPIQKWESKRDKGTFILEDGNRVSGTSKHFVLQYLDIKKKGKKAIAEIEYPYLTKDNKYFQPRLRQITEK